WLISDEPHEDQLESYRAATGQVEDLLEGADVVDALSSFAFAEQGVVDTPIVATDHVGPFLEAGRRPWVYCCVSQNRDVANRFIALPSVRNRVLGRQLFAHDAPGFLHWGFNFWWAQFALRPIDPFEDTCAGGAFFGGDAFAVYPGPDGTPWPSLRHRVFAQAMADHRALTWLAQLTDRPSATALIDEGGTLTYSSFSYDVDQHLRARAAVDERILAALGLHPVLLAVSRLGRGGVVPAAVAVLVEAVAVGVARVRPLGRDPVGLEGVVDADLARLLVGAAGVLVLAGLGEQVELGVL